MVTNPYKEQQRCYKYIDKFIKANDNIPYTWLVHQMLLAFPVSEKTIRDFIQQFYIDEGIITLENGTLTKKKEVTS